MDDSSRIGIKMKPAVTPRFKSLIWASLFVLASVIPLLVLVIEIGPSKISFWWDFSVALGIGATTLVFLMPVLTARFELISGPFGIDIIYYFHRQMAYVIAYLVVAHPVILFSIEPLLIYELYQPLSSVMLSGLIAALAIITQIVISIGRSWLNIEYDNWRLMHIILAVTALVSILFHIRSVNYYTGTELQAGVLTIFAVIWFFSLVYVRIFRPIRQIQHPYYVDSVENIGSNTWELNLTPGNKDGIRFDAGQFAWITIGNSPFALREHPFSFSSSAEDQKLTFSIKELGDFSSTIKFQKSGTKVYVDGPYGVFTYQRYPAPGYVFIAGGIGIAPMMSMLRTMADRGLNQELLLFYGSRSEETAVFSRDLENLKSKLNLRVIQVFHEPSDSWEGDKGMVDYSLLSKYLTGAHQHYHYFVCGPELMMRSVEDTLRKIGISNKNIHSEIFNLV